MKKLLYFLLAVVGLVVVLAVGYRVYIGIQAGDGEISREVQADRSFGNGENDEEENGEEENGEEENGEEENDEEENDEEENDEEENSLGTIQYGVTSGDDGESEAQFLIEEVIYGEENMVEGTTRQIDGAFRINYEENTVEVGQFEINVRDITTRSLDVAIEEQGWTDGERDTVIRGQILESGKDEFEFSTFDPTGISGAPESISVGDTFDIVVTGDLTIRDVTSSVDFDMELSIDSEEKISGTASTTVRWEDFDITIPYVGGNSDIASVEDSVELILDFTAEEEERLDG